MTKVVYEKKSPYATTEFHGKFLDIARLPVIPKFPDDVQFIVNKTYQYRPDLLAYDLYGDSKLWWVFALRNPNTIEDPIYDMRAGVPIFIPKKETLTAFI